MVYGQWYNLLLVDLQNQEKVGAGRSLRHQGDPRFAEQWLGLYQGGYANLDDDDKIALREFAVVWNIFEIQALIGENSVDAITQFVDDFTEVAEADQRRLLTAPFVPHLTFYREQYIDVESSTTNGRFEELIFRSDHEKDIVTNALIKLNEQTPDLIKALLIIVYHFRAYLFRNLTSKTWNQKQRDNLYHASKVLMKAIDIART